MANRTMTRERMLAIQALPKSTRRHHSCTCGDAPGTKPEFRTTMPLVRLNPGHRVAKYGCSRCRREA